MTTRIELENGKYTVCHDNGTNLRALRHGEEWRALTGDGLVLAMAHRIEELAAISPKLLAALVALEEAARQVMSGEMAASSIMIERMAAQDVIREATVGKCCVPSAEEEALLAAGDYTPEELWGGRRPTCPKCIGRE